ncbi:MAG: hypothetical protein AB1679_36405 [Actinomycetota bacterium]
MEWGYAVGKAVSGTGGWLVNAGPAHFYVDRLIQSAVVPPDIGPLLILRGWFVRRWVPFPIDVELSGWSIHRSEMGVRTRRSPLCHGWFFPPRHRPCGP